MTAPPPAEAVSRTSAGSRWQPVRRRHPVAWMLWVAGAAAAALVTRNPGYLILLGAVAAAVRWRFTGERPGRGTLGLVASLLIFPTLLNLLFSRTGETVLLRLPLPWVGGPYTLEALLFGLVAGIQIASLLMVMAVFTAVVRPTDILRRMPPGLYPAGVSASIALGFVPQARRGFEAIREAQAVRGRQPRGWRDLPGILTPLVVLSLENALGLAEGMAARGWGRPTPAGWRRAGIALGWLGIASGMAMIALSSEAAPLGTATLGLGLLTLGIGLRGTNGTRRYRPEPWTWRESVLVGVTLGAAAAVLAVALLSPSLLTYYPYPRASWPTLEPALALAITLFAAPLAFPDDHR